MKSLPSSCEQCFEEFKTALEDLRIYAVRNKQGKLSESQSRELIISFEVTHELALKVMNTYFKKYGKGPFSGSRDLTVEAFHAELIDEGKPWLDIVIDRIQYNPIYEIDTQSLFIENILKKYISLFEKFEETMSKKLDQ
ncbi:MAG: nucleotidyltransferase substrate binding protein [Bacteroidota bacterium]|uniref:Nucleotidyltransferase substrate binding protein, HI0074 family n=1 Tax=Algoriphagus faecimaris TaxID=686796 RepID=A0A1G6W0J5_9BACT|nr:nucleotidyltransferase substrate binding protein [Algoriphagus faecimaris]SDD58565.1 nucleotidyltransferase substrate binding protein, HI0074 family [Algoriphagus faecimaris]